VVTAKYTGKNAYILLVSCQILSEATSSKFGSHMVHEPLLGTPCEEKHQHDVRPKNEGNSISSENLCSHFILSGFKYYVLSLKQII